MSLAAPKNISPLIRVSFINFFKSNFWLKHFISKKKAGRWAFFLGGVAYGSNKLGTFFIQIQISNKS